MLKEPLLAWLALVVLLYILVGQEVLYKNAPGTLAVVEHLTCWSRGPCKVHNIKALRGTGEIRWIVVKNTRANKETEHVRGFANGQIIDAVCPPDKCAERALCAQLTVRDYSVVGSCRDECRVEDYELKCHSFERYVQYALQVDRIVDQLTGRYEKHSIRR